MLANKYEHDVKMESILDRIAAALEKLAEMKAEAKCNCESVATAPVGYEPMPPAMVDSATIKSEVEAPKKKGRKAKVEVTEIDNEPASLPEVTEKVVVSVDEARNCLKEYALKFGKEKAISLLTYFSAAKFSDLKAEQYTALVEMTKGA